MIRKRQKSLYRKWYDPARARQPWSSNASRLRHGLSWAVSYHSTQRSRSRPERSPPPRQQTAASQALPLTDGASRRGARSSSAARALRQALTKPTTRNPSATAPANSSATCRKPPKGSPAPPPRARHRLRVREPPTPCAALNGPYEGAVVYYCERVRTPSTARAGPIARGRVALRDLDYTAMRRASRWPGRRSLIRPCIWRNFSGPSAGKCHA